MRNAELLQREAVWVRDIARRSRWYADAIPDLSAEERRNVRLVVLHAWIRYRHPISLLFVTNYLAIVATAVGMAVASTTAGGAAVLFARGGDSSGRAPWWLFPLAIWAAVCMSTLIVSRASLRQIASLMHQRGILGMARHMARAQPGYWFVPAGAAALIAVAGASAWLTIETVLAVSTGQQLITVAAGVFGTILGFQWNRWMITVQEQLRSRYRQPHRRRPLDGVLVELASATALCFAGRAEWWDPRKIRDVRRNLNFAIEAANDASVIRGRMSLTDLAARRQTRQFQTALAELIRLHDRAITQVRTAEGYDTIAVSLRAGVLALVGGDLTALMRHSSAEPPTSRAARLLRRTGSSLVLVVFAVTIPLLPGVDSSTGGGVRVLLLMTAALSLTSASDLASGSVRAALERSLLPKITK